MNKRFVLFFLALWSSFLNLNSGINFPSDFELSDSELSDINSSTEIEQEEIVIESTKNDAKSIENFGVQDLSEFSLDDLKGEYEGEMISSEANSKSDLNSMDIDDLEAELDFDDDDFGDEDYSELSKDELSEVFNESGNDSGGGTNTNDLILGLGGPRALTSMFMIKQIFKGDFGGMKKTAQDAADDIYENRSRYGKAAVDGGTRGVVSGQRFSDGAMQGMMESRFQNEYNKYGGGDQSYSNFDSDMDDDSLKMQDHSFDDFEGPSRSTGYDDSGPIRSGGIFDFNSRPSRSSDSGPTRPSRSVSGSSSRRRR